MMQNSKNFNIEVFMYTDQINEKVPMYIGDKKDSYAECDYANFVNNISNLFLHDTVVYMNRKDFTCKGIYQRRDKTYNLSIQISPHKMEYIPEDPYRNQWKSHRYYQQLWWVHHIEINGENFSNYNDAKMYMRSILKN